MYESFDKLSNELSNADFGQAKTFFVQVFTCSCDISYIECLIGEIKALLPGVKIVGATTAGEIWSGRYTEASTVLSITAFASTDVKTAVMGRNNESYLVLGKKAAVEMNSKAAKALIMFTSGIASNCEDILKGIEAVSSDLVVAGGKAGDNGRFERSYVFTEEGITDDGVACAVLIGNLLTVYTEHSFCWEPIGKLMTVTEVKGNQLKAIDNQNVFDIYERYLGKDVASNLPASAIQFPLIIRKENMKLARVPVGKVEGNSLVIDGNIHQGDVVQFGYGNVDMIIQRSLNIVSGLRTLPIESIFIYSCMARKVFLQDMVQMELTPINDIAPSAGFFTYGEFYHSEGCNSFLNETMTILGLSEKEGDASEKEKEVKAGAAQSSVAESRFGSFSNIKALTHLINTVTTELSDINHNLEHKNQELNKALNQLKDTQDYLMSSDKLASIGNLISGVAHELNTPLAAIKSNLSTESILIDKIEALEDGNLGIYYKSLRSMNEINKKAMEKVLEVIEGIQSFCSFDGSDIKQINLNEELDNILLLLNNRIRGRITISKSYGELPLVTCYAQQLNQALLNILKNSIQSIEGAGEISIATSYQKDKVMVTICNNGAGIKEECLTKGFEAAMCDETMDIGYSMGLAITHKIIEKHKGTINVSSETKGVGCLELVLPVSVLYCGCN